MIEFYSFFKFKLTSVFFAISSVSYMHGIAILEKLPNKGKNVYVLVNRILLSYLFIYSH